ncbi:Bol3 protein [Hanseniaspora uvarum]|nr:Bol3 protein [Hanseniaspora uvarum]
MLEITINAYSKQIHSMIANSKLNPSKCIVKDISGGCGSMFEIHISSSLFNDMNKVKQHKFVNTLLKDEIKKWHGMVLHTSKE